MVAALKLLPTDDCPVTTDVDEGNKSVATMLAVMRRLASACSPGDVDQEIRASGSELVEAIESMCRSSTARAPVLSLEERLRAAGVGQRVLDNLEHATLHMENGYRIWHAIERQFENADAMPLKGRDLLRERTQYGWEHVFARTFLGCLASGLVPPDAPGIDFVMAWMRVSSRSYAVVAMQAEDMCRTDAA